MKLNIGCGKIHFDGYVNMDISGYCNPDIKHDLRKGLPMFKNNSINEIIANGVLEMILPNEEFLFVLNELWRVLESDGQLHGQVPSTDPGVMMLDPFDRRWFMKETFNYWNVDEHSWKTFGTQYGFSPWHVIKNEINDGGILCFSMKPANK